MANYEQYGPSMLITAFILCFLAWGAFEKRGFLVSAAIAVAYYCGETLSPILHNNVKLVWVGCIVAAIPLVRLCMNSRERSSRETLHVQLNRWLDTTDTDFVSSWNDSDDDKNPGPGRE